MKRIFLIVFLFAGYSFLPALSFAQVTPKAKAKPKSKTTVQQKTTTAVKPAATEFTIKATITGYPEGATVELLNGQTGATEIGHTE